MIKMLADREIWHKWANAGQTKVADWAALPVTPPMIEVVASSQKSPAIWRYTTQKPIDDWVKPEFDAGAWLEGPGTFGTEGTPGAVVRTKWSSDDIWLRRVITLPNARFSNLRFYVDHDEDVEIYVNGVLAASEGGFTTSYVPLEINPPALALLRPGATVTLAVHCHQTTGGQNIDVGLVNLPAGE